MAFEVRCVKPEELEEYKRIAATALVMSPTGFAGMQPEWTLCGFEGSKLTVTLGAWPMTMRFNGAAVPISAVTSVGTLPPYRRQGQLRRTMTRHFENLHEAGERNIAALWAAWAAIYQRYGYGIVSTRVMYAIEPQHIQFAEQKSSRGKLREISQTEIELLKDLYRRFVEFRTGYLHRSQPMWQASIFSPPPPAGSLNGALYEENGMALGYMVYATIPVPGDQIPNHRIQLRDLVWLDIGAYRALWEHMYNMDLLKELVWQRVPPDDPLPHLLLEPRRLHASFSDGILTRIVTVEKGLAERGYDAEGELIFELKDDLCPWNTGRWKLEASPKGSKVSRSRQSPQVAMPVSTLAMLAFGQISATEASRMGRLDVDKPDALPLWDNVMRTQYKACCPDMF